VFVRFGNFVLILALAATLGAHWALLQTVAWTTMLADNLGRHSLTEAVARTFDGRHPCCLCKAVAAGKKSGQTTGLALSSQKFEYPPAVDALILVAPAQLLLVPRADAFGESLTHRPLTPPPRSLPV